MLHVVGDKLNRSILCGINHALALTEENGRLQVGSRCGLHILGLSIALVESLLEVSNLTILSGEFSILAIEVAAQTVDLSIQTVNLGLVAKLSNGEVVSTVGVLELVDHTSVQLNLAEVQVILGLIVRGIHLCSTTMVVESP